MLRRSKTITLPDDDDLPTSTVAEDAPILPQQPSISEPLFLERRSGADRRSQEEVRTEFQRTLAFAQEHGTLPSPANAGNFGMKLRIALVAVALIAGGAAAWLATRSPAPAPSGAAVRTAQTCSSRAVHGESECSICRAVRFQPGEHFS